MKKLFLVFLAGACVFAGGLCGCTVVEEKEENKNSAENSLVLMTWNVHNLFDGADNGYEYDEFLQSAGWSQEKYMGRVNVLADAISALETLPDVIVFQELESLGILEDLAAALKSDYTYSHFASNPGAALGVGILSRLPLDDSKTHSITVNGETTPRPVLESRISGKGENIVIFVCHWKSKLGDDDNTENVRRASARGILRRIRELQESEPQLGFIVAGDLNSNHDDFYQRGSNMICALMPDDSYCSNLTGCIDEENNEMPHKQKDFFILSRNRPPAPVNFPNGTIGFYSPWYGDLEKGSYYYRNNWETIDHFLLSEHFFNGSGWEYNSTEVVNYPPFANATGTPIPYVLRTGAGMSDHLPLLLRLVQ